MGFQIVSFANVPTATVGATSSASAFPAQRMASVHGPYIRGWRSTSTGAQTLTFTFGSSVNVVGALLYDVNFTGVTVGGVGRTVAADKYDSIVTDRYKLWVLFASSGTSQTITIPSQTPVDNASYFKCGRIHFFTAYTELQQNPQPEMPVTAIDPQFFAGEEDGSVYESMNAGPTFIREEWSWLGRSDIAGELFTVAKIGRHQPFILHHNLDNTSEAYYLQRTGELSIQRANVVETIGMSFRQIP